MSFTCITCRVAFSDADIQRQHYKTDWHRYNLKRKVADLPPVTAEEFQVRVLQQRMKDAEQEKDHSKFCEICNKSFLNEKSYDNHLNSKRHKLNTELGPIGHASVKIVQKENVVKKKETVEEMDVDSEVEEVSSDEWDDDIPNPIDNNDCLFCPHHSRNLTMNVKHMSEQHSFFIPDVEFCIDIKGFLLYLGSKITQGRMCLWCNDRSKNFQSAAAAKTHMIDKGHCKALNDGDALLEFADYYDYTSSYPDQNGEDDVEEDPNEEIKVETINGNDYQLVLPSGYVIGHRSLMRYYRQNLNPKTGALVQRKVQDVLSSYRQFGYTPIQKEAAQRKARDIQYMRRAQQKFSAQIGWKANKLQKHFRPQVNF